MKKVYKFVSFATAALLMSSSLVQTADQEAHEVPIIQSHEDITVQSNEVPAVQSHDINEFTDELQQKENELVQLQKQLNEKWAKLRQEQVQRQIKEQEDQVKKYQDELEAYQKAGQDKAKQWNELSIKQQLSGILDSFKDQGGEIFDDQPQSDQNVTLHIDTVNGLVGVFSDDRDAKGRPVSQWELNKNSGLIIKTRRAKDGSEVHVSEKEIDIDTLLHKKSVPSATGIAKSQKVENSWFGTTTYSFDEEFDLEEQRNMAFKIMQFMIGFIIVTFGLLYLFFRMTSENEQEARKQDTYRGKAINNRDSSFVDFLSGRQDYKYIVKPQEATKQMRGANFSAKTSNSSEKPPQFKFVYSKAQLLTDAHKSRSRGTKRVNHRSNTGFGGNNLEHLANEERGRFDHIDLEATNQNDFQLLANFSKN